MDHEVGGCHVAGEDEGDGPGEEAKDNQDAADEFYGALEAWEGEEFGARDGAGWEGQDFLGSVFEELQAGHDAEDAEHPGGPGGGQVGDGHLGWFPRGWVVLGDGGRCWGVGARWWVWGIDLVLGGWL